jgi:hypothetical protein
MIADVKLHWSEGANKTADTLKRLDVLLIAISLARAHFSPEFNKRQAREQKAAPPPAKTSRGWMGMFAARAH